MPTKKRRAKRETRFVVNASISAFDLPKSGSAIRARVLDGDGTLVGTVWIGQGSLQWSRANAKRTKRLAWIDFFDRAERLFGR